MPEMSGIFPFFISVEQKQITLVAKKKVLRDAGVIA